MTSKNDYLPGTSFEIEQPTEHYHFNSDTALLGNFLKIRHKDTVLDIGCNQGALLLYASLHQPRTLTGIDLYEEQLQVARRNLERYGIEAELVVTKVQDYKQDPFDVVICNPPYFKCSERMLSENPFHQAARHEIHLNLEELFQNAARLCKDHGHFFLVHRASRIQEILTLASQVGFKVITIQLAYEKEGGIGKSVLLDLQRGSGRDLQVEAPVFLAKNS